jgi:translation initiation factor IF-3
VSTADALATARQRGLDLVEVAPTAVPPVCRLLDYGRFKYEQEKKEREARKNQKVILLKEVRLRPKTDEHDLDFKTKNIERFIEDGEKVKVTIRFRGRELAHPNIGRQVLEEVAERLKNVAVVERMPQLEGSAMTMILSKAKAAAEPRPTDGRPPGENPPPAAAAPRQEAAPPRQEAAPPRQEAAPAPGATGSSNAPSAGRPRS